MNVTLLVNPASVLGRAHRSGDTHGGATARARHHHDDRELRKRRRIR